MHYEVSRNITLHLCCLKPIILAHIRHAHINTMTHSQKYHFRYVISMSDKYYSLEYKLPIQYEVVNFLIIFIVRKVTKYVTFLEYKKKFPSIIFLEFRYILNIFRRKYLPLFENLYWKTRL